MLPEDDLLARLRGGEAASFEALVRREGPRLLRTARRLLDIEEQAREAVRWAFLAAFQALHQFRGTAQLSGWLHRIVIRRALMELRASLRGPEIPIEDLLPRFLETGEHAAAVAAWNLQIAGTTLSMETGSGVRKAIARLPLDHRIVLVLADIEAIRVETVARILCLTPSEVKQRLHRARLGLATQLSALLAKPRRVRSLPDPESPHP